MEIEKEQLSESERAQMRGVLRFFMMEHPARAPLSVRFFDRAEAIFATGAGFASPRTRLAGVLTLGVVFLGAGTSYAAESALPGDVLYPVKIQVNEKVAIALAPNPSARAGVVVAHTVRRLQEAETLAAQGRLTASTSAQIQSALQDTAQDFDRNVAEVAHSSGGAAAAADLQSNFEVTLTSHARALTVIQTALPQTDAPLTPILATVVAHAERAKEAQVQQSIVIAASTSPAEADVIAGKERRSAQDALSQIRSLVAETKQSLGTTTADIIAQQAFDTEQSLNAGQEQLDQGDTGRATSAFQAAIRTAAQTKTDVDTAVHLKKILPLLDATSSAQSEGTTSDGSTLPPDLR
jgi:hypothetical protein